MQHALKVAAMIGVVVASAALTFTSEASAQQAWIRESIRSSKCAQGNLKKCKPYEPNAPKVPAQKEGKQKR